ncbi:MAG TPA: YncE family protein [Ktedonobacteraceae bacterium]|nr:YncE family protein [Ktedonobacteraceae bacterium]
MNRQLERPSSRSWLFLRIGGEIFTGMALLLAVLVLPGRVSADGGAPNLAYVAGTPQGIGVIDIQQQKVTKTISVPGDPHTVLLSLDGRFLYVSQPGLNRVSIISASTGQTICSANVPGQPTLLSIDPGTNILYAAGNGADRITGLSDTTCALKQTITLQSPVYGLAVAVVGTGDNGGTGNQLWASENKDIVYYNSSGKQLGSFPIPGGPQYITIPAGSAIYTTTRQGAVYAIDLNSLKVTGPLISDGPYGTMDYDAMTDEIYVPNVQKEQIDVLTPLVTGAATPHEPARIIPLGVKPESIAITSDGQLGFVALNGGNVAMLDIPGQQLINTIHVGGNPHFIITGLYPPLIGSTPQQASFWSTVATVVAYVLVAALIIIPILFYRRYSRARSFKKDIKE